MKSNPPLTAEEINNVIEETRIEFKINERDWQHECFEGDYVPEMIKYALQKFIPLSLAKSESQKEIEHLERKLLGTEVMKESIRETAKQQERERVLKIIDRFQDFMEEELGAVLRGDIPKNRKDSMLQNKNIRTHFDIVKQQIKTCKEAKGEKE